MTASAVATRQPTKAHIHAVGTKLAERMTGLGLTYDMLAADWGVSHGTVRNTFRWPTPASEPKAERITLAEKALELPEGTLLGQYYKADIDESYWDPAAKAPAKSTPKPTKKKAVALGKTSGRTTAALDLAPTPVSATDSPLRRRLKRLEHVTAALATMVAEATGRDVSAIIAELDREL